MEHINEIQRADKAKKHLYDYVIYDSAKKKRFAESLEAADEVTVYAKLPKEFFISTPVGRYSPDWAIGGEKVVYDAVDSYETLIGKIMKGTAD